MNDKADGPPSFGLENPLLRAAPPLAALGLVALVAGRVLGHALAGVGVGMGKTVVYVGLVGAVVSQVFAFAAMMAAVVAVLLASRSRLPLGVRIAALTLGAFAVLPTVWSLHQQVPEMSAAMVAGSASLLALIAVPSAIRAPFARAPGLVIGFVALGGLVRLAAVGIAYQAGPVHFGPLVPLARAVAAAAFLCDMAAVAVALAWIASRGKKKLYSPGTLAIMAVALFLTRQALAGQQGDAHGFDLLAWRAAVRLLNRPEAALPLGLRIFVSFLAPLAGLAALSVRGPLAPLGAAVALALAARGAVEMPPCALMLVVGALAAALHARDERALWASLSKSVPDDRPGP